MSLSLWDKKPLTFRAGDRMRVCLSNGTLGLTNIYVVGVINDNGIDVVMYRWWVKHKRYWRYEAETVRNMSFNIRFWRQVMAERHKREKPKKK